MSRGYGAARPSVSSLSLSPSFPSSQLSLLEDAVIELRKFEGELKIKSSHMSHIRIDVSDTSSLSQLKGGRSQWFELLQAPVI